jgi:small-conductance mechanosensitive channel
MTEYELIDALNSTAANAWIVSQYGLSIVTGYLLVAYFIGSKLTKFQVYFVSIVFFIMHSLIIVSLMGISERFQLLNIKLSQMGSDLSVASPISVASDGAAIPWPAYVTGILVALGCFYFMWSVRHPKTG